MERKDRRKSRTGKWEGRRKELEEERRAHEKRWKEIGTWFWYRKRRNEKTRTRLRGAKGKQRHCRGNEEG